VFGVTLFYFVFFIMAITQIWCKLFFLYWPVDIDADGS